MVKNYLAPNVNKAEVEKCMAEAQEAKLSYVSTFKAFAHVIPGCISFIKANRMSKSKVTGVRLYTLPALLEVHGSESRPRAANSPV